MRKIGIHIEKGGSGKTTTAGTVGFELSRRVDQPSNRGRALPPCRVQRADRLRRVCLN